MVRTALRRSTLRGLGVLGLALALAGCTHLAIEDCGGTVLGQQEPRIRSSHWRMVLADLPAAAARFAPYAVMSTLAYAEDADCGHREPKIAPDERTRLEAALAAQGWREWRDAAPLPPCEDDRGLYARVWRRDGAAPEVVLAFRGTWGLKDWLFGNLHWFTRWLPMEDQYDRARALARHWLQRIAAEGGPPPRLVATGHSLGGGLAQHVLYSFPAQLAQAIAFDPTPVTGFADQSPADQVAACGCDARNAEGEARILRVYDAYEVLANLRIVHKTLLPPERHIQEVRFPNARSHSMLGLADYLLHHAASVGAEGGPWFAGRGQASGGESCTDAFRRAHRESCARPAGTQAWQRCPQ